jgi:hypothetical protein
MPDTNSINAARSPLLVGTGNGGDALSIASMSSKVRVGRHLPSRPATASSGPQEWSILPDAGGDDRGRRPALADRTFGDVNWTRILRAAGQGVI